MAERIPRRLMRFNRNQGQTQGLENQYSSVQEENYESPIGRPTLSEIPDMSYGDISAAKEDEAIKKRRQQEDLEKIALSEVEKFKKQNNRMPTKEESDQIAENLYGQLKNSDISALYPDEEGTTQTTTGPQHKRFERAIQRNEEKKASNAQTASKNSDEEQIGDIKSLLEEDTIDEKKSSQKDEFDLGLDEEDNTSLDETIGNEEVSDIESLDLKENTICPNCKKTTEKVIYCPKCGSTLCNNCAKKEDNNYICPKCGMRIKT